MSAGDRLTYLDPHPQNSEALEFESLAELKPDNLKFLPQGVTSEAVVRWVRGEAARDDVLVERGVVFFKIIDAGRFEHSLDFAQAAAPVRDVVQKSEAENRIRHAASERA